MKILLSLIVVLCGVHSTWGVCTPEQCEFGFGAVDGSGNLLQQFRDNLTKAEIDRSQFSTAVFGYTLISSSDACNTRNACGDNSMCSEVTPEIYHCNCTTYFEPEREAASFKCVDKDECANGTDDCDSNADCQNLSPGFNCTCKDGFVGDGNNCTGIDECSTGANNCSANADCEDKDPGFDCICKDSFTGDGYNCTDLDECSAPGLNNCSAKAICQNEAPGFNCTCDDKSTGDGYNCTDIDECALGTDNCNNENATCTNTDPGFQCTCNANFTGDGVVCEEQSDTVCFNFTIVCAAVAYSVDLADDTSDLYKNVTNALRTPIKNFITSLDSTADLLTATYNWINSTDGFGDGEADINLCVNGTNLLEEDFLKRISEIQEVAECGAIASADECSLNTANCAADTRCQDTKVGYCCFTEFEYVANITIDGNYSDASFANSSLADYGNLVVNQLQPLVETLIRRKEVRGCVPVFQKDWIRLYEGSIVAVLRMLFQNTTLTIDDITQELEKLVGQSTTFGTIIQAGDFDECVSNYDDLRNCSALADCINFAGNFSCECNATYYDNGTAAYEPGQICINPIIIDCDGSNFSVSILSDYYADQGISLGELHLADDGCNMTTHSAIVGQTIQFTTAINECNTTLTTSSDNKTIIASNYVTNLPSSGVFTGTEIRIPFECELPANINITAPFNGTVNTVTLPSVAASGEFNLEFGLWNNNFGTKYGSSKTFASNEMIYGQVRVLNSVSNVGVKLNRCWGTPSSSRTDSSSFEYLADGCSTGAAEKFTMISNGEGPAKFSFQMFFFTEVNQVYLHCDVNVCTPSCKKSCSKRRRRDVADKETEPVTITVKVRLNPDGTYDMIGNNDTLGGNQSDMGTYDIVLPVVAAILAFVLIILLALLVIVAVRKHRASKSQYDLSHVNMHAVGIKPPEY